MSKKSTTRQSDMPDFPPSWYVTNCLDLMATDIADLPPSADRVAVSAAMIDGALCVALTYGLPELAERLYAERATLTAARKDSPMKTVAWKVEPKGPGRAVHMFTDAHGERVELLAYDCPASHGGPRMCGFEVFARLRKGGPFHDQLAAGEATSLEEAKAAALAMVARPRDQWTKLPRSWVKE